MKLAADRNARRRRVKLAAVYRRAAALRSSMETMEAKNWQKPEHWIRLSMALGSVCVKLANFPQVTDEHVHDVFVLSIAADQAARDIWAKSGKSGDTGRERQNPRS